ncbi:alpha-D-ribose 1-methylphosphonate 5-triphosphate synthase subunit PhnH [Antarctobacter heliothermus]|uniref:Alpha-D-ribose 1-methylphosphonate 5-triphosphate synthase subunit PhnH n=1 Tax=Antarctobacter heliothermus TaxID=74033 RepID=A0A222E5V2_9RHOB|nr:phosphonate C-P lyase system protein PhnH [Antarctobacter heliothermus]ASP21573.1 alpha-D-ribose 1-methylphosphonate 5-triphosphate synthase subunit PhnH [Antarctobacter heliothermus]
MLAAPVPSEFESRCNATFDALMWALSRPGMSRDLHDTGQAQIVDALIDRECAIYCDTPERTQHAARSGAAPVSKDAAEYLFLENPVTPDLLPRLRQGSDLHPEEGATVVLNATLGIGQDLRLTGPGVDGSIDIRVAGLPDGFWRTRAQVMRYPMGFEIFLVDGARILGVPRSTVVEVL